jgi:hypothetical protein
LSRTSGGVRSLLSSRTWTAKRTFLQRQGCRLSELLLPFQRFEHPRRAVAGGSRLDRTLAGQSCHEHLGSTRGWAVLMSEE